MSELIRNINPLLISSIEFKPFKRLGVHPLYYKLHRKRFGWLAWKSERMFDHAIPARVEFRGPSRQVLLTVETYSNRRAQEMRDHYVQKLEDYLTSFRRHQLQAAIQGTR